MAGYQRWTSARTNQQGQLYLPTGIRAALPLPPGATTMWVTSMGPVLLAVSEHAFPERDQWNHEKASHLCELMAQSEVLKRMGNGSLARGPERKLAAFKAQQEALDEALPPEVVPIPVNKKGFLDIPLHIERRLGVSLEAVMEGTLETDVDGELCLKIKLKTPGRDRNKATIEEKERVRTAAFAERERIRTEELTRRREMRKAQDAAARAAQPRRLTKAEIEAEEERLDEIEQKKAAVARAREDLIVRASNFLKRPFDKPCTYEEALAIPELRPDYMPPQVPFVPDETVTMEQP